MNEAIANIDRMTLAELAAHEGVHITTAFRWLRVGIRSHKLPSFLRAGRRFVSVAEFNTWLEVINAGEPGVRTETPARAERVFEEFGRRAERIGL